jgi:hypothetical protein
MTGVAHDDPGLPASVLDFDLGRGFLLGFDFGLDLDLWL